MIGMVCVPSSKCHLSRLTSTKASGTDSKNISVEIRIPACCIPNPADTLKRVGVKAPTLRAKGCASSSLISSLEKVLLCPVMLPRVLIFLVAMI